MVSPASSETRVASRWRLVIAVGVGGVLTALVLGLGMTPRFAGPSAEDIARGLHLSAAEAFAASLESLLIEYPDAAEWEAGLCTAYLEIARQASPALHRDHLADSPRGRPVALVELGEGEAVAFCVVAVGAEASAMPCPPDETTCWEEWARALGCPQVVVRVPGGARRVVMLPAEDAALRARYDAAWVGGE